MPACTIDPHPLFAGPDATVLDLEQYYARHPCVADYLRNFSSELCVENDFRWGQRFLARYSRVHTTYADYRHTVERLLLWSWIFAGKSALTLTKSDFGKFVSFCKSPPPDWVGVTPVARFLGSHFNEGWRPFSTPHLHKAHTGTLVQIRSRCNCFYKFLQEEDAAAANPVATSKLQSGVADEWDHPTRHSLSADQLTSVLQTLERRATGNLKNERALFIVAATVFMCLRATDLAIVGEYYPSMDCFAFENGGWWLAIDRPGAPPHRVAVTPDFLPYLERYRKSRGLQALPEPNEGVPMLETTYGRPGLSVRQIRDAVQEALLQVHAELTASEERDSQWNVLLTSGLRLLKDSGAKKGAQTRRPADLQRDLRSVSLTYTYGRYYRD